MNSVRGGHRVRVNQWLAAFAATCPIFGFETDRVWRNGWLFAPDEKLWQLGESSLVIIGAVIGAIAANIFGRRRTLLCTSIFAIPSIAMGWMISESSTNITIYVASVGFGITSVVIPLYISEIAGIYNRRNLMVMQLASCMLGFFIRQAVSMLIGLMVDTPTIGQILWSIIAGILMLFHVITLSVYPETPHYLNWKKDNGEPARSLTVRDGGESVTDQDSTNPHRNQYVNNRCQRRYQRIMEIFGFEDRRDLAMIFLLIVVKRVIRQESNESILITALFDVSLDAHLYLNALFVGLVMARLFISVVVMFTTRPLEQKLSVLLIIFVCFIAAIIGTTSVTSSFWVVLTIFLVREISHLILIGITLAYAGECFPINKRATAFVAITMWEVILRCLFRMIDDLLSDSMKSFDTKYITQHSYINCASLLIVFIVVLIFYPSNKKTPSSEITIRSNEQHLMPAVQEPVVH